MKHQSSVTFNSDDALSRLSSSAMLISDVSE